MAEEKLITVNFLQENMGAELFQTMADSAINSGANFLAGKATSAFQTAMSSGVVQESMELVGNVTAAAGIVKTALDPARLQQITESIIGMTIDVVTSETGKLIGEAVGKITNKTMELPNLVMSYAQNYFNENKLSMGDLISELSISFEKREEEKSKKAEDSKMSQFTDKIKNVTSQIENGISMVNDTIGPVLNDVVAYLENGPDWLADKLNKEVKGALNYASDFVNDNLDKLFKEVDAFAISTAEEVGIALTSKYNEALRVAAKKINDEKEKLLQKGLIKAKAVLQSVNLKLMAITGIAIPLPI